MSDKHILLVGERATDIFVYGNCDRLSPESPVVIQCPTRIESNYGMAGNVYSNILSLNPEFSIDFLYQTKDIYKIRHIDEASGQHLLRVDDGDDAFEPDLWLKIAKKMADSKKKYSAFVYSDYDKGLLSINMLSALTQIANNLNIPSFLDTKKILGEWSADISFVKINDKEFKNNLRNGIKEPWKYCKNLIVTRGKEGSYLYDNNGNIIYHSKSVSGKVWSIAGAGDTVLSALVTEYITNSQNINNAMDFAMKAAAIAVSKPGVVSVLRKEVEELL